MLLYWYIGQAIVARQRQFGWGSSVVENIAKDLRNQFPRSRGFSANNVWMMRQFYAEYSADFFLRVLPRGNPPESEPVLEQLVQDLLSPVPWGHHVELLKKAKAPEARLFYLRAAARFGWSRNVLLNQIKSRAFERSRLEKKTHNFVEALPEHLAEQADEMLKSSYNLEFLGLRGAVRERELEERLASRVQAFLLELGYGFCFVGRQYRVSLGSKEYFIDLLFYHRFLRSLVAFDLKIGEFQPEYAGKMDFHLNVLNDRERASGDGPSLGIILCASKDDVEVEYALRSKANPIKVAAHTLQPDLPDELRGKLPASTDLARIVRAEMDR